MVKVVVMGDIRVGISMCLLGERVRHDGGHKRDRYVVEVLAKHLTFVPVCPEVEIGLGVPRETLQLVRDGEMVRMVATETRTDYSASMRRYSKRRARELGKLGLDGYILKAGSPSCGMERVRAYTPAGGPARATRGLFAAGLTDAIPLLPVEEEGRLGDSAVRESFVERVFAYHRLRQLFAGRWRNGQVVDFHAGEKLSLMAHSAAAERALSRLLAEAKSIGRSELAERYQRGYMNALARPVPRARHVSVLQHMIGYLERDLDGAAKAELLRAVVEFKRGAVPLLTPLTLIRHYAGLHRVGGLMDQSYLEPHPKELMLRNRA